MRIKKYVNLVKKDVEKAHNLIWVRIGTPIRAMTGWQGVLANGIFIVVYLVIQFYWTIVSCCLRAAHAAIDSASGYWKFT